MADAKTNENAIPNDPFTASSGGFDTSLGAHHGWDVVGDIGDVLNQGMGQIGHFLTSSGKPTGPIKATQAQLREGAQNHYKLTGAEWAKLTPKEQATKIASYVNSPSSPTFSADTVKMATSAAKAATAKPASTAGQTAALEKQIASGPWSQLGQSLVKQYQQAETPTLAAISGTLTPSAEQSATAQAEAAVGGVPASSGSWLQSQEAAANANAGPVEAAMAAEGKQYAAEEKPITAALTAYSQANEEALATAPESSWLNAALSHITSNVSYYGAVPTSAVSSLEQEPALVQALEEAGGQGGTTEGLTPLTSIKAKGVNAPSSASAALTPTAGTVPTGSVPAPTANAGSG